jgi:hypothetical protein
MKMYQADFQIGARRKSIKNVFKVINRRRWKFSWTKRYLSLGHLRPIVESEASR